jgi:hypothetical protein
MAQMASNEAANPARLVVVLLDVIGASLDAC